MLKDRWTEYETEKLKSMAGTYSTEEIAEALGRRVSAIRLRAHRLNLSLAKRDVVWTDKELQQLKKLAQRYSAEYIGKKIGKTANEVKIQASKLNLCLKPNPWTAEDEIMLDLLAGVEPVEVIAKRLNRSVGSVRQKAQRSGIDLRLEVDNYSAKTLAETLGICRNTVSNWAKEGKLEANRTSQHSQGVYRITRKAFKDFYHQYKNQIPTLQKIDPEKLEYVING